MVLLTCKEEDKFSNKIISSAFLGHQVRGGRGEVVLTQDDLLESLRHTVGRDKNMPGGDEDPGTPPGWIRIFEERHPGPVL